MIRTNGGGQWITGHDFDSTGGGGHTFSGHELNDTGPWRADNGPTT